LQVNDKSYVVKDAHLITSVWYVLENDIKEDFLFCTLIDGRATSLELFSITNHSIGANKIK
jgi:hypothetical protein